MKIVKRVSLLQGIHRIEEPPPSGMKTDRIIWNIYKPYRLPPHQELYRFGYRNYKHKPWLIVAAFLTFLGGAFLENVEKSLMDNEREVLYRYRLRERQHSGIWLSLRLWLTYLMNDVLLGNLYPLHEVSVLRGSMLDWEEKFVRYQQYQFFMKNRSSKYDFLELGVLQKFPYPSQKSGKEKAEGN